MGRQLTKWVGAAVLTYAWGLSAGFAQTSVLQRVDEHFLVRAANERTTLDRSTGELTSTVDVTLYNLGGRALRAPLHAVIETTSDQVSMPGALGGPGDPTHHAFYIDLSPQLTAERIEPGESAALQLTFVRDRSVDFSYAVVPFAEVETPHPPIIVVDSLTYSVDEGSALVINVTASDPDGDVVSLKGSPSISNATFAATKGVAASGAFTFSPSFTQQGSYVATFTARDPGGLTDSQTVRIYVDNVNRAPTLSVPATATVNEGDLLTVSAIASDPDHDPLLLTATPLSSNMVFVSDTGVLTFTPDFEQAGSYDVEMVATDGMLSSPTRTLRITVADVPTTTGGSNELTLVVDPVESPTFLTRQRITGAVNAAGGAPPREPSRSALINSLVPSRAEQGATLDVTLTGQAGSPFAPAFSNGVSTARFGPGITVNRLTVVSATEATANLTIASGATPGPRHVTVTTGREVAISVVGFGVAEAGVSVSGALVDEDTTTGIAGAIIAVQGTGFSTTTGADGTFTLNGLPPGTHSLLINPPNHEPIWFDFAAEAGQSVPLGTLGTPATVFDPNAPASVSLLSILGRGVGAAQATGGTRDAEGLIRDALLLAGGMEAGMLDTYGNQLNDAFSGPGLMSLTADGARILAEHFDRGESYSLAEILLPFSFGFTWTNGPPLTLAEWLEGLQSVVDQAWSHPNDPNHYLPVLTFNQGSLFTPDPPVLSPETRLNQVQAFLFVASMVSYMADPAGTNQFASLSPGPDVLPPSLWGSLGALIMPPAYAGQPAPTQDRRWTSYWRDFSQSKGAFIDLQRSAAFESFNQMSALMMGATLGGGIRGTLLALPLVGLYETRIVSAFFNIEKAQQVPEAPRLVRTTIVPGVNSNSLVFITFRRSPTDEAGSGQAHDRRYVYSLYRFKNFDDPRTLVDVERNTGPDDELVMFDLSPQEGASFYALTASRISSLVDDIPEAELAQATPWWNAPVKGITDPLFNALRSPHRVTSDYSEAALVNIGPPASLFLISGLVVNTNDNAIYYSDTSGDASQHQIVQVPDLGEGEATIPYALTGFASPGHQGLAIDQAGRLYTRNRASDALFGGRIFRFDPPTPKTFVGSINYYSRDLGFANPTLGGPVVMGPPASPGFSDEDLYVVDTIAGQVKRVPVKAGSDPFHHVGQPYANYPFTQQCIDIAMGPGGTVHLLVTAVREALSDSELDIDIEDATGQVVAEELEASQGSIGRIVDPGLAVTNRRTGLSLSFNAAVDPEAVEFFLEATPAAQSPAGFTLFRDGTPLLGADNNRVQIAADELDSVYEIEAFEGGVVDVTLQAYFRGTVFQEDTVRFHAAPGIEPQPGRHVFVNPAALGHDAPYDDFLINAASSLVDALAIAAPGDTILVARETTQTVSGARLRIPADQVILAGLSGRFDPSTTNHWGTMINYDWDAPHPVVKGDGTQSLLLLAGRFHVQLSGFHFVGGRAAQDGAGIAVTAGDHITVGHCAFSGNHAQNDGGAMLWQVVESAVVERCRFGNQVADYNRASGNGGAIAAQSTQLTVRDCRFLHNRSLSSGGAISLSEWWDFGTREALVDHCLFEGNLISSSFPEGGGAIHSLDTSFAVQHAMFKTNSATLGGAIAGRGTGLVAPVGRLSDVVFTANTANNGGGAIIGYGLGANAISCDQNAIGGFGYEIRNALFESNVCALSHGGAVFSTAVNSYLQIEDTDFIGNRAPGTGTESDGGAVAACSLSGSVTASFFHRCLFESNVANNGGGGIYHTTGACSTGKDLEFYENTGQKGGAIEGSELTSLDFTNIIVGAVGRGNVATDRGGGIYMRGGRLSIEGDDPSRARIVGNRAADRGGAIAAIKTPSGFVVLDPFSSTDVSLTRVTVSDNEARHGGALYLGITLVNNVGNDILLQQCIVERNRARNDKADDAEFPWVSTDGFYVRQNDASLKDKTSIVIRDSILRDHPGAAITFYRFPDHLVPGPSPMVYNSIDLVNTRMEGNELGLQWRETSSPAIVRDCTFSKNTNGTARVDVLAVDSSSVDFRRCDFDAAAGTSAALLLTNPVDFSLVDCDIQGYLQSAGQVGLRQTGSGTPVQATSCYWGDPGGPHAPPAHSNPVGSFIEGADVVYDPYLASPFD